LDGGAVLPDRIRHAFGSGAGTLELAKRNGNEGPVQQKKEEDLASPHDAFAIA